MDIFVFNNMYSFEMSVFILLINENTMVKIKEKLTMVYCFVGLSYIGIFYK